VTAHRITVHGANVIMGAQHRAGETLQNDAESPARHVEMARLEPDTIGIWNPVTTVCHVDIGNEMFAAPSIRIDAVGETVEGSDWQMCTLV
jgi:hypothetical protein